MQATKCTSLEREGEGWQAIYLQTRQKKKFGVELVDMDISD